MESQTSEYPNQYYTPKTVFLRLQCPNAIGPVCKGTLSQLLTDISTVSWVHAYFCILICIPITRSRLAACTRPVRSRMATCLVIRICNGFRRGLHVYIGQPATVCHYASIQLRMVYVATPVYHVILHSTCMQYVHVRTYMYR